MILWELFIKKRKGCLDGKTEQEKIIFFSSLSEFAITNKEFFKQSYWDLLPRERQEFSDWIIKDMEQKKIIKSMITLIEHLLQLMQKS